MIDYRQRKNLIQKCRDLRQKGYALSQILSTVGLPKTTVYGYIKDIILTAQQRDNIETRKKLLLSKPSPKRGKCQPGREIYKPRSWSANLIHIVAHFMFDGHISEDGCIYYNRSKYQIEHLKDMISKIFGIQPKYKMREDGVIVIAFYNVEFVDYIKSRTKEIFFYLKNGADKEDKRIFIQTFFDDEGNVYYKLDKKRVRGYQKSKEILENIKNILSEFNIKSTIYSNIKAIEITGKENLVNFAREINFSPLITLNPNRKNSIWRKEISKREVLNLAISSYKN